MFTLVAFMSHKIELWMKEAPFAILHEGIIHKITGTLPGKVVLDVHCDYLRKRSSVPGSHFIFVLSECKTLSYTNEDDCTTSDWMEIVESKPEMLSSDTIGSNIVVYCSHGILNLNFREITVYLNSTDSISVDGLETLARDYWDEWENQTERNP